MMDFLKANPHVTKDQYMWEWTVPQIRLASYDNTHVEYLSEEQAKIEKRRRNAVVFSSVEDFANDLGVAIVHSK